MAKIITDHRIVYKGEFLPAGTHPIDDKDVEAMRPFGKIIEEKTKKSSKKQDDDILS